MSSQTHTHDKNLFSCSFLRLWSQRTRMGFRGSKTWKETSHCKDVSLGSPCVRPWFHWDHLRNLQNAFQNCLAEEWEDGHLPVSIPHHFRIALRVKLSRFSEVEGMPPKQVPGRVLGVAETQGHKPKTCGAFLMGSTVIMKWVEADMELPIVSCHSWNHMYAEMMWTGAQRHLTQSTPHTVQLCSRLHTVPSINNSSRSRLVAIFTRDLINRG